MDPEFVAILQKLIAEQGKETLLNPTKCKAFLSDYTRNEYKKESRFLLQALEAGVQKAIDTTDNITICKLQQIRLLHEDYGLDEKVATGVIDTLALILRGDKSKTEIRKEEPKLKSAERTIQTVAMKPQQPVPKNKERTEQEKHKRIAKYQNCISAGYSHTVGLKTDGTVVAVGNKESGKCNIKGWSDIIAVAAGGSHTVGLKADGTVVTVGSNENGQCNTKDWRDIVAIATSGHTVGLKADGTVVATGENDRGQCNTGSWRSIVAIAAASSHTVGLKSDGTVVVVGSNDNGQCNTASWRDIVAIAAGSKVELTEDYTSITVGNTFGLKADGTVVAVGYNKDGQCNIGSWRDIVAISSNFYYTVGLKADGTVVAVGNNDYGRCNIGSWRNIGPASEEQILKWRRKEQGLCQYCGGVLVGTIFKKCKSCGKAN